MSDLTAMRKKILATAFMSGEGHVPSAFSILEIMVALYDHVLDLPGGDRCVLSKGHGVLALYAVLAEHKIIPDTWDQHFCQARSFYEGHPNHLCPGVEFSGGSLGQGLGAAAGLALGLKIQKRPGRVFAVVGDNEASEGSVWETALIAYNLRLNNFSIILDDNRSCPLNVRDIGKKFRAFGWQTHEVDGHDVTALKHAMRERSNSLPTCIVARTIKGYGCDPLQEPKYHHYKYTAAEMPALMSAVR